MKIRTSLFITLSFLIISALPSVAGVTVASPGNGNQVSSPFPLSANASTCSSQTVASMGYSLDNSSDTTIVKNNSVNAAISSGVGYHVLHVKAWGNQGAVCVTDIAVTISGSTSGPVIPSNAVSVSNIQTLSNWRAIFDGGTGSGSAPGGPASPASPSRSGHARQFSTSFINYGGELYSASFGDDVDATNFVYDGWVYLTDSTSTLANLEMDMNQVMPNGQTVIFGFQCDGYSGTWDLYRQQGLGNSTYRSVGPHEPGLQSQELEQECLAPRSDQLRPQQLRLGHLQVRMA